MAIISEALLSETVRFNRLDAEFFDPADLTLIAKVVEQSGQPLASICEVLNGQTPSDYFEEADVPIVRSGDLVAPFIYPSCGRPFLRAHSSGKLTYLKTGDVLISSIGMGSIGKISLVMDAGNFATVSEVTILRSKGYPPEALFAYLTTVAGQRQIDRQITGATGQQHLLKSKVGTIVAPAAPLQSVINSIRDVCAKAWQLEMQATDELARAHALFAAGTGLDA